MSTVLVHGAGGFVGSAILRALSAAPGLEPVACLRRPPTRALPGRSLICDATDLQAMLRAAHGADYAINAVLGDAATMISATRNLCAAAQASGLKRIVHVSTMSVYGGIEGRVTEDATPDPAARGYAAAKIECEAIVSRFTEAGGEAVILRPGIVYGPGGEQWAGRIGRLLQAGRLGDLGEAGDGFCNLIYHDDLAAAAVASLDVNVAAGQAINLAPIAPPTWNEVFSRFACAIGATPLRRIAARRLRAEATLAAPPLQIAKLAAAKLGLRPGALPEPMPPSLLALFRQRIVLDASRAQSLPGFTRTAFEDALAACSFWFLERAA